MVELQDNWVYALTNTQITRNNNSPSSVVISPEIYETAKVSLTAEQSGISASIEIDFTPVNDLLEVLPAMPELPDFRISQNTISTYQIPRSSIAGNAVKYEITSNGPKEYAPTIFSSTDYTWKLHTPAPKSWTSFYSYGTNQLALVHNDNNVYKMTYYFCPPLGVYNENLCYGIVTENTPYAPSTEKPYILPKTISLTGGRNYFITLEDTDKMSYNLNWVNVTYDKETKKFGG
jgi:hypothetical protein